MVTIAKSLLRQGWRPIMAREHGRRPSIITRLNPRGMKGAGSTNRNGIVDSDGGKFGMGEGATVARVGFVCSGKEATGGGKGGCGGKARSAVGLPRAADEIGRVNGITTCGSAKEGLNPAAEVERAFHSLEDEGLGFELNRGTHRAEAEEFDRWGPASSGPFVRDARPLNHLETNKRVPSISVDLIREGRCFGQSREARREKTGGSYMAQPKARQTPHTARAGRTGMGMGQAAGTVTKAQRRHRAAQDRVKLGAFNWGYILAHLKTNGHLIGASQRRFPLDYLRKARLTSMRLNSQIQRKIFSMIWRRI